MTHPEPNRQLWVRHRWCFTCKSAMCEGFRVAFGMNSEKFVGSICQRFKNLQTLLATSWINNVDSKNKLTRCSHVSGFAHCGRFSAASISRNSPSESHVRTIKPGISLVKWNNSDTMNHSSWMLSPKYEIPCR